MKTKIIKIKKGLDIPIAGSPEQVIKEYKRPTRVALLGNDYQGMKPRLSVSVGDYVKLGQPLFKDKRTPSVNYTSPGSGKVIEVNRGEKRSLLSVVIALEGDDEIIFNSHPEHDLPYLEKNAVIGLLLVSGLWTAIRSRPFSRVADPDSAPHSLFITAIDTNPLAPSVTRIMEGKERDFTNGLRVLSRLTNNSMILCKALGSTIPGTELDSVDTVEFEGPHPAGNVGTHIHYLDPVNRNRQTWYIDAQDVIAVGKLFRTGRLDTERIISLAGPSVKNPRLLKTVSGASLGDITAGELKEGRQRIISGSVLSGRAAIKTTAYLGRFHRQISVLPEGGKREFLGWMRAAPRIFSIKKSFLSGLFKHNVFEFDSTAHGDRRAIVPVGSYEKVFPLDIMPTHLLRALASDDIEEAEKLGCLELDEEDLALCTFVCPSKIDHGAELRRNLTIIEKEG